MPRTSLYNPPRVENVQSVITEITPTNQAKFMVGDILAYAEIPPTFEHLIQIGKLANIQFSILKLVKRRSHLYLGYLTGYSLAQGSNDHDIQVTKKEVESVEETVPNESLVQVCDSALPVNTMDEQVSDSINQQPVHKTVRPLVEVCVSVVPAVQIKQEPCNSIDQEPAVKKIKLEIPPC
jgi:hypothetical protein